MRAIWSLIFALFVSFSRQLFVVLAFSCFATVSAQKIMGTQGMMNVPSADMYPKKTFVGGVNYIATGLTGYDFPVYNYFIDFTPFSFVELTFRSTLLKMKYEEPSDYYCEQDRSFTVKLRPLAEKPGKWYPSIALGSNDFFSYMGHSYFATVYGAMTKHISVNDVCEVATTIGYSKNIAEGIVYDGVFGGVEISPSCCKNFRAMIEYDTKGINVGAELFLLKHLNVLIYTREFDKICGGLSYQYTIKY